MTISDWLKVFVLVLILGLVIAILWLWKDKDNAQAALNASQTVITSQNVQIASDKDTIDRITKYNDANGKLLAAWAVRQKDIDAKFNLLNGTIANLRRTNPDVEKYLAQPIPTALLCLLDANSVCDKTAAAAVN